MEDVRIEQATAFSDEDVRACEELLALLDSTRTLSSDDLHALLISPDDAFFVARDAGGRIVGLLRVHIHLTPFGRVGLMENLIVDPSVRGRGIGRKLFEAVESYARECGVGELSLASKVFRTEAHSLFRSRGFEEEGEAFMFTKRV